MEATGPAHPTDRAFFKFLVILLFGTLTVTRLELTLLASPFAPWYQVLFYFDTPLLLVVFAIIPLGALRLGREFRVRNFWFFLAIPLLLAWILLSGAYRAERWMFFAAGYSQWVLAYLVFLFIPALLHPYKLIDFALDAFLGWSIFAAVAHLGMTALNPGQVLSGVASVFGGNRAHVGLYFLIAMATAAYAWDHRRRRMHLVALVLSVLSLLTSGSRAAQTAAALFLVLQIFSGRSFKTIAMGLPTIAGFGFIFKLILSDRASDSFAVTQGVHIDTSAGFRLIIWLKSLEVINQSASHFFFGIGYSNFRFLFYKLVWTPFFVNASHNMYLHYWVETGLIGAVLFLLVCLSIPWYCWVHRKIDPLLRHMAFLAWGIMFTGLTQESMLPDPSTGNVMTLFFLVLGLATFKAAARAGEPAQVRAAA